MIRHSFESQMSDGTTPGMLQPSHWNADHAITYPLVLGDAENNTTVETDGTLVAHGTASCWDDLTGSLIASQLNSVAGKLDYNWDENSIAMQPGGNPDNPADRLIFNFQIPHGCKLSSMRLHIHWTQQDATTRTFRTDYRIQNNGQEKTTAWTTVVRNSGAEFNAFPYSSGILNQITRLAEIDLLTADLSSTVQFRLTRTDNNAGDVEAVFVDAHVEHIKMGTRLEYLDAPAP